MTDNTSSTTDGESTETRELTVSRVIDASPERIYEAFIDPDELAKWMHPDGFRAEVHELEPEEGGTYEITMAGDAEGMEDYSHTYGGRYDELVPGERVVQTEFFESEEQGMSGEMTITSTFEEVEDGTEVTVVLEIPAAWPDDAIGGWADALGHLESLLADD